jgi:hypothetical protein
MLHRRAAQALTRGGPDTGARPAPPPPVRVFASDASTARRPADTVAAVRRRLHALGGPHRRDPAVTPVPDDLPAWRQWTDLACGYLALVLERLPRPRPRHTVTVFTATPPAASGPGAAARGATATADGTDPHPDPDPERRPGRPDA